MSDKKTEEKTVQKRITPKQKRLLEELSVKSPEPLKTLMLRAGYSESSAKKPHQALKAPVFRDIFNHKISNNMIITAHKKLLKAKVKIRTYKSGELLTEIVQEDTLGISKGVELAYKVKGAFAPVETKLTMTGLESKSDAEIEELMNEETQSFNRAEQFKKKAIDIPSAKVSKGE